jgi:hypothetical protein
MRKRAWLLSASGAAILAAGLGGGVAFGAVQSVPDSGGTIHGCYKPSGYATGALMVIDTDAGQSCPSDTTAINWNQTGPSGPAGPSTAGPSGLDVTTVFNQVGYNGETQQKALCPSSHPYALGGGVLQVSGASQGNVLESSPTGSGGSITPDAGTWNPANTAEGWYGHISSNSSNEVWTVYAICSK